MPSALEDFILAHPRLLVLTGAGCSVASGIPAYRDQHGSWQRNSPIQHQDFLNKPATRQRYWCRSYFGWPVLAAAQPNPAHHALKMLEDRSYISLLITQNVDRLHQRAGQRQVVDLHGRVDQVLCMACSAVLARADLQHRLMADNPHLSGDISAGRAPDGDADVPDSLVADMRVPDCEQCGGLLKPNVVFFGDAVDKALVASLLAVLDNSDALLVVGSSLTVFSGYRFCRHAHQMGRPIACINAGKTRADDLFTVKSETECGSTLEALAHQLC